jgi:tripartite-type tricarboxylate transporter receptor subunit TctC
MLKPYFFYAALALPFALCASHAPAQSPSTRDYPSRPIRIVVPFPSGGTIDMVGRMVAQMLTQRLGQNVVVDNRAGAGGVIGVDLVAKAAPDGYTLCLCSAGAMITSPLLVAKPPYDARRDFAPVTMVATVPYLLLTRPGGIGSLQELLAQARQKPGALNYGSAGAGSTSHLAAALFASAANISVLHVPYKGSAPAAADLMGGQLQFVFEAIGAGTQYHKSGRLRALGISTLKRSPNLPELPTIAEAGVPGYEMATWHTVCAPRGTPAAIVERLNREIVGAMSTAEVRERFTALGTEPVGGSIEQLRDQIAREAPRWERLLGELGLRPK